MEFHYQNGEADKAKEVPVTGLGMIRRVIQDVSYQPGNEHDMRSLTGQQIDELLAGFKANPDSYRVEQPSKLTTAVRTHLEERHEILDLMDRKLFKQTGKAALEASHQKIEEAFKELITSQEISHVQRFEQSSATQRSAGTPNR